MNKYILPVVVMIIVFYGIIKKKNIYDSFIKGTKEGIEIGFNIFPALIAIIFSSRILVSSGFIEFLLSLIGPLLDFIHFPQEIFPMAIIRPISGNASLILMTEIFSKYGVDSIQGFMASVLQGAADTTLYVISLYFGTIGIKKIKYSLFVGLLTDLAGIIASIIITNIFLNYM